MASTLTRGAAVPPVLNIASAAKVLPTSSLKVKLKVMGPVAVVLPALCEISTVGGTVSTLPSVPPPQAPTKRASVLALTVLRLFAKGWFMCAESSVLVGLVGSTQTVWADLQSFAITEAHAQRRLARVVGQVGLAAVSPAKHRIEGGVGRQAQVWRAHVVQA